jgi:hypothetical protein
MSHQHSVNPKILISTIRRNKVNPEVTKSFDEFPSKIQQNIITSFEQKTHEEIVILSFSNSSNWVLLSTDRIIWRNSSDLKILDYIDIEDVGLDRERLMSRDFNRNGYIYKRDSTEIQLIMKSGEKIWIDVGESSARFGFMHALGWAICKVDGRLP